MHFFACISVSLSLRGQNGPTCVTRDIYLDASRVYSSDVSRSAWRLKPSLVNQVHMKDNDCSGLLFLQNLKDFGLGIIIFVCNRWCFGVNRVGLQGCLMPLVKVGWVCLIYITYEHKTSHKGTFLEIEIYASSESWINHIYIDVWFGQYLKIWNLRVQKHLNIEKISFKVVQMKFLAMHINNQKLSFDIFMVINLLNMFMEHDPNDFWHKIKIDNF